MVILPGIIMGYEELFPTNDLKGWHANAAKRFASPFVDNFHDRIDVDPIILSNAAVHCGFTIRDFYVLAVTIMEKILAERIIPKAFGFFELSM